MAVASLPMYDLAALAAATDAWWSGLARAFRREGIAGVPQELSRGPLVRNLWKRRDLLFSQTCGYPLIHELHTHVRLVATPCYAAPGCDGPDYRSIIVVPADSAVTGICDLEGTTCVINRRDSQSGCNALRSLIAPFAAGKRFFSEVKISGNHAESLRLVAERQADVAAIDCVTYALHARHEPHLIARTRTLCLTPPAPGLPYITSRHASDELVTKLRNGLHAAFEDPALAECRGILMLTGCRVLPLSDYDRIAAMETEAASRGCPSLE